MTLYPQRTYAKPLAPFRTARDAEYDIVARVTQKLIAASASRNKNTAALLEALMLNERLWSTLAEDVARNENGLPQILRARLFHLYRFTVAHSRRVRHYEASVDVLIDINTAIMRGLRTTGPVT